MDAGVRARRALVAVVTAGTTALAVTAAALPGPAAAAAHGNGRAEVVSPAEAAPTASWRPAGVSDDRRAGKVFRGLGRAARCHEGFAVEALEPTDPAACSHGPDAAPLGVDVQDVPTTAELAAAAPAKGGTTAAAAGAVPCYGDGVTGKRVQVVYAVASDVADRYAAVADLIRGYAADADAAYLNSAARDGGVRHVRWVTGPDCRLDVAHVVLSPTGDDTIANTRTELRALGYSRTDRKYLVFADAGVYCGISYVVGDDRPDATNPANAGGTVSRVDAACWGGSASVPAHELAHALGAVQLTAPHSNGNWHCTDEYDRLCYDDGSGAALTYLCASSQEPLLDCNGDDYFNVRPVPGSWLATHWNLASSAYLESAEPTGETVPVATPAPTTATPTPVPSPTVVPVPTPTAAPTTTPTTTTSPRTKPRTPQHSATLTGRVGASGRATFTVSLGSGPVTARLQSSRPASLRLQRVDTGAVVLRSPARRELDARRSVLAGRYRVSVHAARGTQFRTTLR